jgi:hypothetical protein
MRRAELFEKVWGQRWSSSLHGNLMNVSLKNLRGILPGVIQSDGSEICLIRKGLGLDL